MSACYRTQHTVRAGIEILLTGNSIAGVYPRVYHRHFTVVRRSGGGCGGGTGGW